MSNAPPHALPMDNILKFYGEENKKQRNELVATVIALKQEVLDLKCGQTPTESVDDLREEIKALKEKLESVNDVMNTINRIVK